MCERRSQRCLPGYSTVFPRQLRWSSIAIRRRLIFSGLSRSFFDLSSGIVHVASQVRVTSLKWMDRDIVYSVETKWWRGVLCSYRHGKSLYACKAPTRQG